MRVYTSKHVIPIVTRPIRDGAVAVSDGAIVAVGGRNDVISEVGSDAEIADLGRAVILPGLVNAHTHLELSWMAGNPALESGDYSRWLRSLLALRDGGPPADASLRAEQALVSMMERGTVAVGDVTNDCETARLLARRRIHGVVFFELLGLRGAQAETRIAEAVGVLERIASDPAVSDASDRLRVALTPHAPHTTSPALLRALVGRATAAGAPLSIHVAESQAELALMSDGSGPLAELFRARGFVDEADPPPGRHPIEHLFRLGVLSERTLAVHCVHLENAERAMLRSSGATVVTCPRSNQALGVGLAAIPTLLGEGVPVAIGTDSLASAPDLDMFGEMRALLDAHPRLSPAACVRMATFNGARALGLGDRLGSIEGGKLAELIAVPLPDDVDDPFEVLCTIPERVYRLDDAPQTGV